MDHNLQQTLIAMAPSVLPVLTILLGILSNNRQIDFLRSEIVILRTQMATAEGLKRVEEVMDAR